MGENIPFGTTIKVKWLDSVSKGGWIYSLDQLPDIAEITSQGYVIRAQEKTRALTLSTSLIDDRKGFIDPISIPWASIVEVEIKEPPDRPE